MWEKITVVTVAVLIVALVGWLVVRNEPFADPNLVVILRIIISLAVAALGATVPGFLHVGWSRNGALIRAGDALALFIVTYLFTPAVIREIAKSDGPPAGVTVGRDWIMTINPSFETINGQKNLHNLLLLLTDRGHRAGTPIANDRRYNRDEKVTKFKGRFADLSRKLLKALVKPDIYGEDGVVQIGRDLHSHMWNEGRELKLGFAAAMLFEPLPSPLRSDLSASFPGLAPFLDLFTDIAEPAEKELARLQGEWRIISATTQGERYPSGFGVGTLYIVGSRWIVYGQRGELWARSFRVFPEVAAIDFADGDDDLFRDKGNLSGTYSLHGDELSIATREDPDILSMRFRRRSR